MRFDRASYGQAPIALLGGFGNIKNEFDITPKTKNTLILKPKVPMGRISHIEITTTDGEFPAFPIQALTIVDNLSNTIEIYLKNVRINTGIKDRIFEFSPPEGVRILRR
jgi:outer membrane lipoprotein-sorting protein